MRIVITGGLGYIGSMLSDTLCNLGHKVIVFDNLWFDQGTLVSRVIAHPTLSFYKEDVLDWTDNLKREITNADVIIPLAALVGADLCDKHAKTAQALNEDWFTYLLPYLDEQLVIYPNSNSAYGTVSEGLCTEETPVNPLSLYSKTKQATEDLLLKKYDKSVCFRLATVMGWSFRPRTDLLVNNLVKRAVEEGHLSVFNPAYRRNFVHVRDVVKGFIFAINNHQKMVDEVFNLGNDYVNMDKLSLVKIICEKTGASFSIDSKGQDRDMRDYEVSSQKLYNLGYSCEYNLKQAIEEMIKFYSVMSKCDDSRCRNY
jgi:nucleoside-diphosphate-sugar epimerase